MQWIAFKPGARRPVAGASLVARNWYCPQVCMCLCVCVCVCSPLRLVITSGMMWCNIDAIWLVNKFYNFCMAPIVSIISRHGLRIEAHHRNQPNKSKLAPLLYFYSYLKQLYISNKTKCFSYKCGCGMHGYTHIEVFKRRASFGYR